MIRTFFCGKEYGKIRLVCQRDMGRKICGFGGSACPVYLTTAANADFPRPSGSVFVPIAKVKWD